MKTIFLSTIILICTSIRVVCAQDPEVEKHSFRLEAGYAFTGSGDLYGFCLYNEYSHALGSRFRIAPAAGFMNFFRDEKDDPGNGIEILHNANLLSFDLTGYIYPLLTPLFDVEAGLGLCIHRWHRIYAAGPDQAWVVGGHAIGPGDYFAEYITAPGYSVSIGIVKKISGRTGVSIRGVYQNDSNGDNTATLRFGLRIGL